MSSSNSESQTRHFRSFLGFGPRPRQNAIKLLHSLFCADSGLAIWCLLESQSKQRFARKVTIPLLETNVNKQNRKSNSKQAKKKTHSDCCSMP